MFWQLLFIAVAFWIVYLRWQRRRIRKIYTEISPGNIQEFPVVGHAHLLRGNHEVMTDPETVDVVLKSCMDKDDTTMRYCRTVTGNGSIFAAVPIWRPRRKILAPTFSMKNLNQFVEIFAQQSNLMTELLRPVAGKGDFSIWKYMNTYSFDSVCESALGVQMNSQQNSDHRFMKAFEKVSHLIARRIVSIWMHPDVIYKSLPIYKVFKENRRVLYNFVDKLIQIKREELKNNNNRFGKRTFLEMMIMGSGGERGYTNLELREEVLVIILAGTDTSAVGASYVCVLLSRFPKVQEKVYEELRDVFGDSDRPLTVQDLPNLKYLDAVIRETLRMYPPVPVTVREVHNDVVLPSGVTLVDGVSVINNIWGIHRNPKYWGADADVFRPERFLEGPLKHPAQFIPFSYASRNCLGYNYAMMSMKTVIANLVRAYKVLPPKDLDPARLKEPLRVKFDIMMKPVDNYVLRLESRK
ncbi:cytochrome P450 4C1-like isoform X2 [Choristoneura fumiferana]|uniref:cytochrome P450 4C1-like isoform X2 n=1 Tax=Choristoneura fumiferana TaxID=7141 RepID=UPI003D15DD4F